jgi:GFO/IDH/MocA oxidoreductase family protein
LLTGRGAKIGGYPANFHVRDFLDCVKTRGKTRANADAACHAHIACHAANVSLFLGRKVLFDPVKSEFIGDAEANRLRSEALREPWRI